MYLKATGNLPPLTLNLQSAFCFLMDMLGSTRAKFTEMCRQSFAKAMQEEGLADYFSLFAHLAFHYIYMENAFKYTELLSAICQLNPQAKEDAILVAFRKSVLAQGGRLLEAQHKVQEDRRRLMMTSSFIVPGGETLLERDARLASEQEKLKVPLLPIQALFALVEKIVGLCIEKRVLDEAEVSFKEKINADPARWIMRLIPIFDLLRHGRADELALVIKLTLDLVASRAPEHTIAEIKEKLTELKWVEVVPSPPEITCPLPDSELDMLVFRILERKELSGEQCDEEEVQRENATPPVAAPLVAVLPKAQKKTSSRDQLRIFVLTQSRGKPTEKQLNTEQSQGKRII